MNARKSKRGKGIGAGHSAEPIHGSGPTCGHGSCGPQCNVRYVGLTSHIRDHHAFHASRGVTHVWAAAIVSGLAVVLTGAIAYTAVSAQPPVQDQWGFMNARMERLERSVAEIQMATVSSTGSSATSTGSATSTNIGSASSTHSATSTKPVLPKKKSPPKP